MAKDKQAKTTSLLKQQSDGPVDPRFNRAKFDPRFVKPKLKDLQVKVDDRFKKILKDDEFSGAPKVDKYGRKVQKDHGKEQLKRYYRLEEDSEDETSEDSEESDSSEVAAGKVDRARGEGIEEVEESSDESDYYDEEVEEEFKQAEAEDIPQGEVTRRFAVVNLDWDNLRSVDLLKLFSSFLSDTSFGIVKNVQIFKSQFGKERLAKEETEGPPAEIFAKNNADEEEDDEEITAKNIIKTDTGEEFDNEALRRYQLERLRYFYAIVTCDSKAAARYLYQTCDGTEFERSANFLDLRYVPDDTTFDNKDLRDEASEAPEGYKPLDFTTDALRHSKVRLTWDDDDPTRTKVTRSHMSKEELQTMDFKAYLASDDEQSEDEATLRSKYRALLGGNDEKEEEGKDGDMQITFTPGLAESAATNAEPGEETTLEAYKRKERERKQRKKEQKLSKNDARIAEEDEGEYWEKKAERAKQNKLDKRGEKEKGDDVDEGFDDPFFAQEREMDAVSEDEVEEPSDKFVQSKSKKPMSKTERMGKIRQREELELLLGEGTDGKAASKNHFDMKQVLKSEKNKKKKKRSKAIEDAEDTQDTFQLDVKDPRFDDIHENPAYAIDPTNPQFKKTTAMSKLLQERQERKSRPRADTRPNEAPSTKKRPRDDGLDTLVQNIKKRANKT